MIRVGNFPPEMTTGEINKYIDYMREKYPDVSGTLHIILHEYSEWGDDREDEVELILVPDMIPFQRIRRITGYLVGDLSRFNNAKRREVDDRVKHMGV